MEKLNLLLLLLGFIYTSRSGVANAGHTSCAEGFKSSTLRTRAMYSRAQQVIFPSMKMKCNGEVQNWHFNSTFLDSLHDNYTDYLPLIETWRPNTTHPTLFHRVSSSGNLREFQKLHNGYKYMLKESVKVQANDVIGIQFKPTLGPTQTYPFFQSVDYFIFDARNWSGLSFHRETTGEVFDITSQQVLAKNQLLPTIRARFKVSTSPTTPTMTTTTTSDSDIHNIKIAAYASIAGPVFIAIVILIMVIICIRKRWLRQSPKQGNITHGSSLKDKIRSIRYARKKPLLQQDTKTTQKISAGEPFQSYNPPQQTRQAICEVTIENKLACTHTASQLDNPTTEPNVNNMTASGRILTQYNGNNQEEHTQQEGEQDSVYYDLGHCLHLRAEQPTSLQTENFSPSYAEIDDEWLSQ